jgi:AhpD family alkylhydroperoxidase
MEALLSRFPIHTLDTAPDASRPLLVGLERAVGMIPNLAAGMAESPTLLAGFLAARETYQRGTLSGSEIQMLSLVAAYENECAWCMAFHSRMAEREGASAGVIDALRRGQPLVDARFGPLTDFGRAMIRGRGRVAEAELERFLAAGYSRAQALEVVLGMSFSLMANYAGHLVDPPLDQPLSAYAWRHPAAGLFDTERHLATP